MAEILCKWCFERPAVWEDECLDCASLPGHKGLVVVMRYEKDMLKVERDALRAALAQIQAMTREFIEANKSITHVVPSKAFWRIVHVENIAREALKGAGDGL